MRLAQDGDGGRAAGGVGAGARDGVVRRGDVAGGRRAALDLGDQVEAGRGERVGDGRGSGAAASARPEAVAPERVERAPDVRAPPRGDLEDDAARGRPRRLGDAHAGAPSGAGDESAGAAASAAAFAASATRRSSRSLPSSSIAEPGVDRQRRPVDPVLDRLHRARRDQRGARR